MQQDTDYTDTLFRRFPKREGGDVIALFPLVPWNRRGECASYMHVGQHGAADLTGLIARTRPAKLDEPDVRALHDELQGLGYRVRVLRRSPPWRKVCEAYAALENATRRSAL